MVDRIRYTGAERASSTDPRDWGRALATALDRLLAAARLDGHYAQHEHLCGVDLILRIEEDGDGAKVAVQWVPEDDDPVPGLQTPGGKGLSKELAD